MSEVRIYEGAWIDGFENVTDPEPDTSLHIMGGPQIETPQWVIDSWQKAAVARKAEQESQANNEQ